MKQREQAALAGLLIAVAACSGGQRSAARVDVDLDVEAFIEVFMELRQADFRASTPEEFSAMKDSIMDHHDTSPDELRDFVRSYSRDVDRMSAVWDTIEVRIRRVARGDTTAA